MLKRTLAISALSAVLTAMACTQAAPPAPSPTVAPTRAATTPARGPTPPGQVGQTGQQTTAAKKTYPAPPPMNIDPSKNYSAVLHTTEGDIRFSLALKDSPITVNNFVFLAKDGFYDGVKFHRVIKNFMIQGGDPQGNGTGGPGYKFNDEMPVKGDYSPGTVAMANAGPNTNGSQFFIMHGDWSNGKLAKNYVIFGKVTQGQDVVDKIANVQTRPGDAPVQGVVIKSVEIIAE